MFVAIGAQKGKKLRLENIDANNVFSAVEMLDEIGHGHRPDYTGKTVAVIGGGNVAWMRQEVPCAVEQKMSVSYTEDVRKI